MKRKLKIAASVVVALIAWASAQLGTAEQFIETVDKGDKRLFDGALTPSEQRVIFAQDVTEQCFKKHQFDGFHANAVAAYCRDIADSVAGHINVSMMRQWPHWSEGELQSLLPVLAPTYGKLTVWTPGLCRKAGCTARSAT
jgi:hypothetical protein